MKSKTVLTLVVVLALSGNLLCYGADFSGKSAFSLDLSQSALSWEAGGLGLTMSYERVLGNRISVQGKGTYMHLADAPGSLKMILASLGFRWYFAPPALKGFFAGLYPMAGVGIEDGTSSFLAGGTAELGYTWRVGKTRRFLVEPYIKYPYFAGQPPLIGIAPGISLGYMF